MANDVLTETKRAHSFARERSESKLLMLPGGQAVHTESAACAVMNSELVFRDRNNNGNILLVVVNEVNLNGGFDLVSDLLRRVIMDKL